MSLLGVWRLRYPRGWASVAVCGRSVLTLTCAWQPSSLAKHRREPTPTLRTRQTRTGVFTAGSTSKTWLYTPLITQRALVPPSKLERRNLRSSRILTGTHSEVPTGGRHQTGDSGFLGSFAMTMNKTKASCRGMTGLRRNTTRHYTANTPFAI